MPALASPLGDGATTLAFSPAARVRSASPQGAVPLLRCGGDSARFATGQFLLSSGKQSEQSVIEGVLLLARPSHCWAVDGGRNVVTQSGAGIAPLWRSQVEPASIPGPLGSCEQLVRKAHACAKGHTWPVQRNGSHHWAHRQQLGERKKLEIHPPHGL